jgi:hypothetical protein
MPETSLPILYFRAHIQPGIEPVCIATYSLLDAIGRADSLASEAGGQLTEIYQVFPK